jgi:putative sigma-54 modulation protein
MNINIKGLHIELTDAITNYVHAKLEPLSKLLIDPNGAFAQVEVGKESTHHSKGDVFKAEINLRADGKEYYVVSQKDDLYAAIDDLKDQIIENVKSVKNKSRSRFRRGATQVKNFIKGFWPWKGSVDEEIEEVN